MGNDDCSCSFANLILISIHAPAWGATSRYFFPCAILHISIHAPRMGSDREHRKMYHRDYISIHAPRMGSDSGLES